MHMVRLRSLFFIFWIMFGKINSQSYIGCYQDNKDKSYAPYIDDLMTVELCRNYCIVSSIYFELMAGDECNCVDSLELYKLSLELKCVFPCSGDGSQVCGGSEDKSIYYTSDPVVRTTLQQTEVLTSYQEETVTSNLPTSESSTIYKTGMTTETITKQTTAQAVTSSETPQKLKTYQIGTTTGSQTKTTSDKMETVDTSNLLSSDHSTKLTTDQIVITTDSSTKQTSDQVRTTTETNTEQTSDRDSTSIETDIADTSDQVSTTIENTKLSTAPFDTSSNLTSKQEETTMHSTTTVLPTTESNKYTSFLFATDQFTSETITRPLVDNSRFCVCYNKTIYTIANTGLDALIERAIKGLAVDKTSTNSFYRSKISVKDHRPSAQTIGFGGILALLAPLCLIIITDLSNLCKRKEYVLNKK